MSVLISIHDVTPALAAGVSRLWQLCAERRVRPALLVVPDWHGNWPLDRHPDFAAWLRARAAEGAEIVLHGERHDEAGLARTLGDRLRAWGRTAGEAEFLTLDAAAAGQRIARGLACLLRLGLRPVGFVPPAWLAREEGHRAAGAAGLGFSEDERSVRLFPSGRRISSPVVRWSARTAVRARGSAAVARARWTLQRSAPLPRLAFHPQDLDHPVTARSVVVSLDRWLTLHRPVGYSSLAAAPIP
ncbi:MAG TPA: polysaccharide deacetylase family protein [Gemmatimonadales bacterium]|nr:polysaccharide deacetylase family protein [Gemmatimonadales bacterium]